MLLVSCPWCGPRSETEFRCGGEAKQNPLRPDHTTMTDKEWVDYLCNSNNVRGPLREHWCHEKGCGEWFELTRNTATHCFESDNQNNAS
jgi:sarcosine oxidase subunit delta